MSNTQDPLAARIRALEQGHAELLHGQHTLEDGQKTLHQDQADLRMQLVSVERVSRQAMQASEDALAGVRSNRVHFDAQISALTKQNSDTLMEVREHHSDFRTYQARTQGMVSVIQWGIPVIITVALAMVGAFMWGVDTMRANGMG